MFSRGAAEYAAHRPRYPAQLFAELAARAPRTRLAWDCATGNGQAAIGLAAHFNHVIATDASAEQLAAAVRHDRVTYRLAGAEHSGLERSSIDVVTVAQALHWLDIPAFFAEAMRVLVPGGLVAVWCYGLVQLDERIDRVIRRLARETLGAYWRPERQLVETGYRTVDFPFEELELPPITMEQQLSLDQLAGYLRTWSAAQRYVQERGEDPVAPALDEIAKLWGDPTAARLARRPLSIRVGRVE